MTDMIASAASDATPKLTPERLAEIADLLRYESSIAFYSHRAKESMLLLLAEANQRQAEIAAPLAWARALDADDLHSLVGELSAALLGYWHDDPDAAVLARVEAVLTEHRNEATGSTQGGQS